MKDSKKEEKNHRIKLYAIAVYYVYQQCFTTAGIINNGRFEEDLWAGILLRKLKEKFGESNVFITGDSYETYLRDRYRDACNYINDDEPYKWRGFSKNSIDAVLKYAKIENYEELNTALRNPQIASSFTLDPVINSWISLEKINQLSPKTNITVPSAADEEPDTNGIVAEKKVESQEEPDDDVIVESLTAEKFIASAKFAVVYTSKPFKRFSRPRIPDDAGHLYFNDNGDIKFKGDDIFIIQKAVIRDITEYYMAPDEKKFWLKIEYTDGQHSKTAYFAEPDTTSRKLKLLPSRNIFDHFKVVN